jgi:hypothetical protein
MLAMFPSDRSAPPVAAIRGIEQDGFTPEPKDESAAAKAVELESVGRPRREEAGASSPFGSVEEGMSTRVEAVGEAKAGRTDEELAEEEVADWERRYISAGLFGW